MSNTTTILPPATYSSQDFFDIEKLIRTDPFFYDKLEKCIKRIVDLQKQLRVSNSDTLQKLYHEAFHEYLSLTNFNISPLLGYYYPTYPLGTPYSLKDFPFAHIFYALNVGANCSTIFKGSRQISKCVTGDTMCTFKNKNTGQIVKLSIKEFFDYIKSHSHLPQETERQPLQ